MPKPKTRKRRADAKSPRTKNSIPRTVAEYAARVPKPARARFRELRSTIRSVMPSGATEVMSYSIPAFRKEKIIVWFAAFEKHCSLFPTAAVITQFSKALEGLSCSKGTIHFPLAEPLPIALIKKIVRARLASIS
jgi:uncharacterized protein YdhG (YjbR/CyaY superfamily)